MRLAVNGLFLREPHTGTGQYLARLLAELARPGGQDEVWAIAPPGASLPPGAGRARLTVAGDGARILGRNLAKVWFEQVVFPRACASLRVEAALVPHWGSPVQSTVPTAVTIHDLIPRLLPEYRGSPPVRLYTRLVSISARRAAAVLADSECSRNDIVTHLGLDAARVHAVHLAVGPEFAPRSEAECTSLRARLELPEVFLLYLGGFDVRKNLAVVLAALARLDLDIPLVCAGTLPTRDTAFAPDPRRLAREAGLDPGRILWLGPVKEEDKPALYASARAIVFPSRYEGFGLPPLEALACGTPVLAARAASLPEVVGEAGLLLDPDDASAWAQALRSVWTNPSLRARLREAGLAQAGRFTWETTSQRTRAVLASIARH